MKKLNRLWIFACLLAIVGSTGCSDYFDTDIKTGIKLGDNWDSHEKVRRSTLGAFEGLTKIVEQQVVLNDLRADLMHVTENYDGDLTAIANHEISINNKYANPRPYYEVVSRCNEVLSHMDKALVDPTFTEEIRDQYRAEIIALRSWVYFQLALTYKQIPIITDPLSGYDKDFKPQMYTFSQTVNWLITEMEKVAGFNTPNWSAGSSLHRYWDRLFINKKAFLGELHLWAQNPDRAAALLLEVINTGGENNNQFKLSAVSGGNSWKDYWSEGFGENDLYETVTAVPFLRSQGQSNDFARLFSFGRSGDYLLKPSAVAIDLWKGENGGNGDYLRGEKVSYTNAEDKTIVFKYFKDKTTINHGTELLSESLYFIYRAADLHLMFAEAMNRMGKHGIALKTINSKTEGVSRSFGVRKRVGLPEIDLLNYTGLDNASEIDSLSVIENVLLDERAKELAFEGRRWSALMRFAARADNPGILADRVAKKIETENGNVAGIKAKLLDKANWRLEFNMDHIK